MNLNAMLNRMQDNVDNEMNPDVDYLYSIHDRSKILMIYHCEIKKMPGTALTKISKRSSMVLIKWAWPNMMLHPWGILMGMAFSSIFILLE